MAMKLTTGILTMAMMAGGAWAQNPHAIDNTRSTLNSLQPKPSENAAVLIAAAGAPQSAKPVPGSPAPAVKPVAIPTSPSAPAPAKAAAKPATASSGQNNKLEKVNVIRNADDVQIELNSREAVTPRVSKLSSPARVVVELPGTVMATAQSKIPVGDAGVKGVRIGMDGKTPPTTSVVVDLEKACAYELTPGTAGKFVLTLHTGAAAPQTTAKTAPAAAPQKTAKTAPATVPAKPSTPAAKPQAVTAKPVMAPPSAAPKIAALAKAPAAAAATATPAGKNGAPAAKTAAPAGKNAAPTGTQAIKATPQAKPVAVAAGKPAPGGKPGDAKPKPEEKKWAMTGKRDPFFSPVVQQLGGSGCSTGKKCLEIGNINLRGIVKSDAGFIAVVTNSLNKAYFLRENDPVFNGYVVKITGDSVIFQETMQDKLGKPFTREVVKRIFTPAV